MPCLMDVIILVVNRFHEIKLFAQGPRGRATKGPASHGFRDVGQERTPIYVNHSKKLTPKSRFWFFFFVYVSGGAIFRNILTSGMFWVISNPKANK